MPPFCGGGTIKVYSLNCYRCMLFCVSTMVLLLVKVWVIWLLQLLLGTICNPGGVVNTGRERERERERLCTFCISADTHRAIPSISFFQEVTIKTIQDSQINTGTELLHYSPWFSTEKVAQHSTVPLTNWLIGGQYIGRVACWERVSTEKWYGSLYAEWRGLEAVKSSDNEFHIIRGYLLVRATVVCDNRRKMMHKRITAASIDVEWLTCQVTIRSANAKIFSLTTIIKCVDARKNQ